MFSLLLFNFAFAQVDSSKYLLQLKLHPAQVLKYGEEGSSVHNLLLPGSNRKLAIESTVKGGIRISVANLDNAGASSIVMMARTELSQLQSPLFPGQKPALAPDISYDGNLDSWGNLKLKTNKLPTSNPALIASPLTIVPLFAPVPESAVQVGTTWQASDRIFNGLNLSAPGSVATFQLKTVSVRNGEEVATIEGKGQVPVKMSADDVEEAMSSANMAAPAMNMSIAGRVEWTMTESLNITTGTVENVVLKTSTHLKLHLIALDAETTDEGTGSLIMTLLPANSDRLPN